MMFWYGGWAWWQAGLMWAAMIAFWGLWSGPSMLWSPAPPGGLVRAAGAKSPAAANRGASGCGNRGRLLDQTSTLA
jgi:hypothetical protein